MTDNVVTINLKSKGLDDRTSADVLKAELDKKPNAEVLRLDENRGISTWGFTRMLSSNKFLVDINLSNTSIGDAGLAAFCIHLLCHHNVRIIVLERCGITSAGALTLGRVILPIHRGLRQLSLSGNRGIGNEGGKHIFFGATSPASRIINILMEDCNLTIDAINYLEKMNRGRRVLSSLYVGYNPLGDAGAAAALKMARENPTFTTIGLENTGTTLQARHALVATLGMISKTNLHTIYFDGNPLSAELCDVYAAIINGIRLSKFSFLTLSLGRVNNNISLPTAINRAFIDECMQITFSTSVSINELRRKRCIGVFSAAESYLERLFGRHHKKRKTEDSKSIIIVDMEADTLILEDIRLSSENSGIPAINVDAFKKLKVLKISNSYYK